MQQQFIKVVNVKCLLLFLYLLYSSSVCAQFKITNKSNETVSCAIGYIDNGLWYSKGWYNVKSGQTITIFSQITNRYYYFYGFSSNYLYSGDFYFSIDDNAFTIQKENDNYKKVGFSIVDVGASTTLYTVIIPENTVLPSVDKDLVIPHVQRAPPEPFEPREHL